MKKKINQNPYFSCIQLKEREANGLPEKTRSLWPYLIQNQAIYENPFYNKATENHICIPNPSILKLVFWSRLHAKYDPRTTEDQLVKWGQQKKKQMSQTTMWNFSKNFSSQRLISYQLLPSNSPSFLQKFKFFVQVKKNLPLLPKQNFSKHFMVLSLEKKWRTISM